MARVALLLCGLSPFPLKPPGYTLGALANDLVNPTVNTIVGINLHHLNTMNLGSWG
jgi:hypothetical protein